MNILMKDLLKDKINFIRAPFVLRVKNASRL